MGNVQKLYCPCGKLFAACSDGHQDDEWNLEVGQYMAKNCTSKIDDVAFNFEKCECPNMDGSLKKQLELDL